MLPGVYGPGHTRAVTALLLDTQSQLHARRQPEAGHWHGQANPGQRSGSRQIIRPMGDGTDSAAMHTLSGSYAPRTVSESRPGGDPHRLGLDDPIHTPDCGGHGLPPHGDGLPQR